MDDARLRRLVALGGRRRWGRREILYSADEPVQAFYKVTKGIVIESRVLFDGRRQIVAVRAPGDLCGYPAHQGRYLFTGEAVTEVEACSFNGLGLDAFIARDLNVACALAEEISEKLRSAIDNMTAMGQLCSTERVAHYMVEIHLLQTSRGLSVDPLQLLLTRQEIADYLGLTLETISRAFTKLRNMRVIALVGNEAVVVLDRQKLHELARQ